MAYLVATCTSRKRSEMVSQRAESCGPETIDRHNVIDILQSQTIQDCRGSHRQQGHGATAPWEAGILLWSHVAVDTIGPWTL
jgi:hypothetical protein